MLQKRLWHEHGEGGCCHHHEGEEHHCCHGHEGGEEHHCHHHEGEEHHCCGHHHEEIIPADRTQAMMMYMINHNAQHAIEVRELEAGVASEEAVLLMEQAVRAMAMSCDFLQEALSIVQQMPPEADEVPEEK